MQKIFVLVCDGSLCFMGACGSGAGAWCTSVLRVSARASEMRCWHWMHERSACVVRTWLKKDVPSLELTDEDINLLRV